MRSEFSEGGGAILLDVASLTTLRHRVASEIVSVAPQARAVLGQSESCAAELSDCHALIVGLRLQNGQLALDRIAELRAQFPHVRVFLILEHRSELASWLQPLAEAGVDEVYCADSARDWRALLEDLRQSAAVPPAENAMRDLANAWGGLPNGVLALHAVRNAYRLTGSRQIWRHLPGRTRRAHLRADGLPAFGLLRRCGQVVHGKVMSSRLTAGPAAIARAFGFATASAYWSMRSRARRAAARWPLLTQLIS
jgi:hypothetical protein